LFPHALFHFFGQRPLPAPVEGWLELPEAPGLGFEPAKDRVAGLVKLPTSRGKGKA